ncbi:MULTISPECIES: phage head closure protein [Peptostreptococcaceae]|uniref:phage head closure protein n=1 Tax=Peptostreptococcaceae TaxID=186804 RepID=UPI0005DAD945|nr:MULTISPECIES: phage head closure protein [Paeniclostridium]CEN75437.1 phage head-tail adaptor protein [[Clostridium] sordellii] [Paeniclostridium sordellii]CEN94282.1 phage head-tail adaptor protein [[Clostridium] sordellii] [Paeniclostridium sordellii]CEN94693.1 phage head-tail adaptor protein [[Clostridium] sordellii] [Paeniclostridium sordellii]CEO25140.1 phage head-tail adaptor protein [[Clostridium] sordellii] [Paeniclostridium sordellii]
MIDIGELRDVIDIQDFTTNVDENGFEIQEYKTISTLRAKVKTQGTKEFMSADKTTTKLTIHVICRNRQYLDSDKFLMYNKKRYNIRHVHILENRQFVQLTCEVID